MSYTLHHGDCRTLLAALPADSHDCCISDPPYSPQTHAWARTMRGVGSPGSKSKGNPLVSFDSTSFADLREKLGMVARVTRRWVVLTCDWRHCAALEVSPPEGLRFVRFGIWIKPNGTPQFTGDRPGQGWEAVAILHRIGDRMTWAGGGRTAVWTENAASGPGLYPTQKPLPLIRSFVSLFATGPVLDPWAGSATSGVAAIERGLDWTGYDVSAEAISIARERLDAASRQSSLFVAEKAKQERFEL